MQGDHRHTCCDRGSFLTGAAVAGVLSALGSLAPLPARAAVQAGAGISADAALTKLMAGNKIFASKMSGTRTQTLQERAALGAGQAPWASILTCADSRLAPEIIFNVGLGDIFVSRVARNVADPTETAGLEYGAAVLDSQLILVMGLDRRSEGSDRGGQGAAMLATTSSIRRYHPALIKSVKGKPGDLRPAIR